MPGVQIRKTTLPVQVRGKDYGQSGPPQQLNQKKLPQSQKLAEAVLTGPRTL